MDERKLGELFNAAVPDVPPPSFDHTDIATESNRQRARRTALLGGSALGVAILAGVTVVGVALWNGTGTREGTAAGANAPAAASGSTGNTLAAPNEVPNEGAAQTAPGKSFSEDASKQGDASSGNAGPPGPASTPSGCVKADPELAAALAGELRAAELSFASDALPADVSCPAAARGAALRVDGGIISVVLVPRGVAIPSPMSGKPDGTALRAAMATGGATLFLVSEPGPGSAQPPLETRLDEVAKKLAARF